MISWLFEIDSLRLSTKDVTWSSTSYSGVVITDSFSGITMRWDISGNGLIAPNEMEFEVSYALFREHFMEVPADCIFFCIPKRIIMCLVQGDEVHIYLEFRQTACEQLTVATKDIPSIWSDTDRVAFDSVCHLHPVIMFCGHDIDGLA